MIRSARIGQAVILMMVVAIAASCTATKDYSSKIFPTKPPGEKQMAALRFLDIDSAEKDNDNWVSTDFIMGRDTLSKTLALDKLSQVFPATTVAKTTNIADTTVQNSVKTSPAILVAKPVNTESEPVAQYKLGEIRTKKSRE